MMRVSKHALIFLLTFPVRPYDSACVAGEALRVGDQAPDFTLPYATKDTIDRAGITLSEVTKGGNVVLAFYPADWSGGCTKEMCTVRDNFAMFGDLGAVVFGISGDYLFSHHEWAKFHDLQFPLLSDHDHAVARAYNSFNAQTGQNLRTVYVVGRDGKIAYVDLVYNPGSDASFERLRAALRSLK